jgi:hypothetical protein
VAAPALGVVAAVPLALAFCAMAYAALLAGTPLRQVRVCAG